MSFEAGEWRADSTHEQQHAGRGKKEREKQHIGHGQQQHLEWGFMVQDFRYCVKVVIQTRRRYKRSKENLF
jgi:hypothetical protein